MYTKFSVQNYILHFEGRKWTARQSIHSNLTIYIFISIIYIDSQTSRNVRRISKANYLGNGPSVYLITHGNGGLFFIPF